jgi:hypothetical protein
MGGGLSLVALRTDMGSVLPREESAPLGGLDSSGPDAMPVAGTPVGGELAPLNDLGDYLTYLKGLCPDGRAMELSRAFPAHWSVFLPHPLGAEGRPRGTGVRSQLPISDMRTYNRFMVALAVERGCLSPPRWHPLRGGVPGPSPTRPRTPPVAASRWRRCLQQDGDVEANPGHSAVGARRFFLDTVWALRPWRGPAGRAGVWYVLPLCFSPVFWGAVPVPLNLCHFGNIERNPGPEGLFGKESFALLPSVFRSRLQTLGLRAPDIDAFAAAGNALLPRWWDKCCDAFTQPWGDEGFLWMNPPFSCLARVAQHLQATRARALVLVPGWDTPGVEAIFGLACRALPLPRGPLFCRIVGGPSLPPPNWRAFLCLCFPQSLPGIRIWWRNLCADGDIEANPGPPVATFADFALSFAGDFLQVADRTLIGRHCVDLRCRSASWPSGWLLGLFGGNLGSATESDALQIVASYELYGSVLLQVGSDGPAWVPVVDDTVARLEAEVQRLRLQLAPPTPAELREALTPATVARFRGVPGLPAWMGTIFDAFETALADMSQDGVHHLKAIWDGLVDAWAAGSLTAGPGASQSSTSSPAPRRGARAVPLGLNQFREQGGRLEAEDLGSGRLVTVGHLQGRRYFLSGGGRLWDISQPPPTECNACGAFHWSWECPRASSQP